MSGTDDPYEADNGSTPEQAGGGFDFQLLFMQARNLLCVAGDDGYIKRVNPEFSRVLGWSTDELLAVPYLQFIHPDDAPATERWVRSRAAGGAVGPLVNRYRSKDGSFRWISWDSVTTGADGFLYAVGSDITEQRDADALRFAAETAVARTNEVRDTLVSRLAHELRTPINVILGFGQLLEQDLQGAERAEAIDYILRAGRHLMAVVDDMLDLSRLQAGRLSVASEAVDLGEVVTEVVAPWQQPSDSGISVAVEPGLGPVRVWADRKRLAQVLSNVVSNAVKYNRTGGLVRINWTPGNDGDVALMVRDTGVGIAPEMVGRLFEPFDRLGAESTEIEGTGLGLTLSRALAREMGGDVVLERTGPAGTTFRVSLKRAGASPG